MAIDDMTIYSVSIVTCSSVQQFGTPFVKIADFKISSFIARGKGAPLFFRNTIELSKHPNPLPNIMPFKDIKRRGVETFLQAVGASVSISPHDGGRKERKTNQQQGSKDKDLHTTILSYDGSRA